MIQLPLFLVLGVTSTVLGQGPPNALPFMPKPPAPGPCPVVPIVKHFNLHAYLGRWYEIERFFNPFQAGDCVTADYQLFPNGTVSVANSDVEEGQLDTIFGLATTGPNPSEGRLVVEFPGARGSFSPMGVPNYNVVATDYVNYAVVYSCATFQENKLEFSWILARRPFAPKGFLLALKRWLVSVNIDATRYIPTIQEPTCPRRQV